MEKEIIIPEGQEVRIEGNKVVFIEKESEDERIRKWLFDFIEANGWSAQFSVTKEQVLAYLEKQKAKEQYDRLAPIYADQESFESALDKAWKFYNDSGSSTVDGCEDNAVELAFAKGFREGFLYKESQKEQKSTLSKSEIDFADTYSKGVWEKLMSKFKNTKGYRIGCNDVSDIVLNAILDAFKWAKSRWNAAEERKPKMIQWTGKNLKEVIDFTGKSLRFDEWFKSWEDFENYVHSHGDILKLFCEDGSHYEVPVGAWIIKTPDGFNTPSHFRFIQKPAEWNEEDEIRLKEALEVLDESIKHLPIGYGYTKDVRYVKDWLKSLRPQPKQEWNWGDEDFEKFRKVLAKKAFLDEITSVQVAKELLNFLKHYRPQPHWKPSKEQMEALKKAYEDAFECPEGCVPHLPLESLYNDLKEL
jgi:hypothetical protein